MNTVTIRHLELGAGAPKIIAPIVGKTVDEILAQAGNIMKEKVDLIEWRADFFVSVAQVEEVLRAGRALRETIGADMPLLFTLRTSAEGGEFTCGAEVYTKLNAALAASGLVDLIDVEIFMGDEIVRKNIDTIHAHNVYVVGSNHDFHATPARDELVSRLKKMQEMGADLPKIAVMPTCKEDVSTLLAATAEMHEKYADRPIITMSMGPAGVVSRLSGEAFGSAATFGAVGKTSAPGQIPVSILSEILAQLHTAMTGGC